MAQNLYLLHYNNYFNRQLKRLETIEEYNQYLIAETIPNINFNPNDGVNTEQILNWDHENPDYIIVEDDKTGALSRWFVVDSQRLRNGQYKMSLKRDSVADHLDNVMSAPCLVEKGYLPEGDPFIFNNEGQAYNQIKTNETLLKDKTGVPWIIGYIPSDAFKDRSEEERTIRKSYPSSDAEITVHDIEDFEYWDYCEANPNKLKLKTGESDCIYKIFTDWRYLDVAVSGRNVTATRYQGIDDFIFRVNYNQADNATPTFIPKSPLDPTHREITKVVDGLGANDYFKTTTTNSTGAADPSVGFPNREMSLLYYGPANARKNAPEKIIKYINSNANTKKVLNNWANELDTNYMVSSDVEYIRALDKKRLRILNTGESYEIQVSSSFTEYNNYKLSGVRDQRTVKKIIKNITDSVYTGTANIIGEVNLDEIIVLVYTKTISIKLVPVNDTIELIAPLPNERYHLLDSPYDMFCIPYSENYSVRNVGTDNNNISINKEASLNAAIGIAELTGSNNVYDVQLLPYCPLQSRILSDGSLDGTGILHTVINSVKESSDGTESRSQVSVILWCSRSNFSLILDNPEYKIKVNNKKEESNLDMYRLCSPNLTSQFEFNAAKNNGVEYYEADCSYKPFAPYIHIAPYFSGLYGSDFNDKRGLILGGDYSLPQLTNAWANYQLNNKNYNDIFQREIQSLELKNKVAQAQDWVQAIGGSFTGSAAGMGTGAAAGPWGAAIGAAIGGTVSLAGGITDAVVNQKIRKDELDKTRTLFQYNLENIQAIPSALSKSSAFVINDRYFPFVEHYTCTNSEKEAFRNKIKYQGMTIMRVGQLTEFLHPTDETFVKGRILRLEGISDDFHILNDIFQEISQGLYIGGQ